jgi:hypothetical protein
MISLRLPAAASAAGAVAVRASARAALVPSAPISGSAVFGRLFSPAEPPAARGEPLRAAAPIVESDLVEIFSKEFENSSSSGAARV